MDDVVLTQEQQNAVEILSKHDLRVKRLSGKPGTGKSTVSRALEKATNVTMCAMTGRAALNINGITMDRLFAYDREKDQCRDHKRLRENMEDSADIVLLDESSQLGKKAANYVWGCCQQYDKTLILVGDWAQARPVNDEWITESSILDDSETIFLTQCHRQSEKDYLAALDDVGQGKTSSPNYDVFKQCFVNSEPDGDDYARLFATNALSDAYNRYRIAEMDSKAVFVTSIATKLRGSFFPREAERLIDDSNLLHNTTLKLGARVTFSVNDPTNRYVNGDMGTLVDVEFTEPKSFPPITTKLTEMDTKASIPVEPGAVRLVVLMDRNGITQCVGGVNRSIVDARGNPISTVFGFPLQPGFAQTNHKSQGQSYDKVYVDMMSITRFPQGSRHGLAYVALSRCRTLAGLKIYGWTPSAIECDEAVRKLITP